MPFTPFHFGPGLFLKSVGPGWCSLSAFVATQVLIDLESLYNLVNRRWPIHRFLHSLPGGLVAGLLVAGVLGLARPWIVGRLPSIESDYSWRSLIVGGFIGGVSHSLLDALFHSDVLLFYPVGDGAPLQGLVSRDAIHSGCLVLGLLGALIAYSKWPPQTTG